jgi:hypothetical protein
MNAGARQQPPVSGLATMSLVAGILSFWLYIVGSVAGIVRGVVARKEIRASAGQLRGMERARAGIILSVVSVSLYTLAFIIAACTGSETCFT